MLDRPDKSSRRAFLAGSALATGTVLGQATTDAFTLGAADEQPKLDGTVRDRLWLWTHPAGSQNDIKLADGSAAWSRMTPVEGAVYMGLRNIYFIHFQDSPRLEHYEAYATSFEPMKRVIWSMAGGGGYTTAELRDHTLALTKTHSNIQGFILDDFLHVDNAPPPHWLASNKVGFPVAVTLVSDKNTEFDRIELVQTKWPSGDYRTGKIEVQVTMDGQSWISVSKGMMPNAPAEILSVPVKAEQYRGLRVIVSSTHDDQQTGTTAESCGFRAIRLFNGDKPVVMTNWSARATSTFNDDHDAMNLVKPLAQNEVSASMTVKELADLRSIVHQDMERNVDLISVVYTTQISREIRPYTDLVDKITMWTWNPKDLVDLEKNLTLMEKAVQKPIILGCYMYDYGNLHPMPIERMKHQCDLGLNWLKEGRIEGMIFLASNICDMKLETVEWTRKWISDVGDQRL